MNNNLYQESIKEATKAKYGRSRQLKSKYIPLHPESCERDMKRVSNAYMRIINQELKDVLPQIMDEYRRQERNDSRMDGLGDLRSMVSRKLSEALIRISQRAEKAGLRKRIEDISRKIKIASVSEWKKTVEKTLGIEIAEDYYKDDLYLGAMDSWVADISDKMPDTPRALVDKINSAIILGYSEGKSATSVQKEIQEEYNKAKKSNASTWAESVTYLNAQINKKNQEDAGVKKYMWYTRRDSRVRPCHRALDGKTIWWDSPPPDWHETKSQGRVYSGKFFHPGEAYGCRCSAVPIFEKDVSVLRRSQEKPR